MAQPYGLMADLHLHNWNSFSVETESGVNSRLQMLLDEIERCAEEVHRVGGEVVVMAGDVFHVRGSVAPSVLNPTIDALAEIHRKHKTRFVIVPGNHDLEGKDASRIGAAVTALEARHVEVLVEPTYIGAINAIVFPWSEKVDDLKALLEGGKSVAGEFVDWEYDAIIHAPIDGVIPGLPDHGLTDEYLSSLHYRRTFAGHYHNHKTFPGKAVSIGALAHHTWSDISSRAGFLIVEPDTGNFRWMNSHLPEFIDLTKTPDVDPADIPLIVDGNYVRMRVSASGRGEVEDARQELLGMGARAVLVQQEAKASADKVREGYSVKTGASLEASVGDFITKSPSIKHKEKVSAAAVAILAAVTTI